MRRGRLIPAVRETSSGRHLARNLRYFALPKRIATLEAQTLASNRDAASILRVIPDRAAVALGAGGISVSPVERPDDQPNRPFDGHRVPASSSLRNSRESFPLTSAVREDRIAGG